MRIIFMGAICVFLSGCTLGNLNSIHRKQDITYGSSQVVDAKQRLVVTYKPYRSGFRGRQLNQTTLACAEPSPDVFSVYAAAAELSVKKGGASGAGSFSTSESGAALLERTTSLQALRDAYFRLCEAYAIGAIDEIDYMIGQRHNQTALMGLLAIEEMKARPRANNIVIGSEAEAFSASAVQYLASALVDAEERNAAAAKSLEEKNEERKAAVNAITALEKSKEGAEGTALADIERQIKAKEEERDQLGEAIANLEKQQQKFAIEIAAYKGMLEKATTGTAAKSMLAQPAQRGAGGCGDSCTTNNAQIAREMVNVVRELNSNDFGPTICLSYLRKPHPASMGKRTAIGEVCEALLREYVAGHEDRRLTIKALAIAAAKDPDSGALDILKGLLGVRSGGQTVKVRAVPGEEGEAVEFEVGVEGLSPGSWSFADGGGMRFFSEDAGDASVEIGDDLLNSILAGPSRD